MPLLERFGLPGNVTELSDEERAAWSDRVSAMFDEFTSDFPNFYNPTASETPIDAAHMTVQWTAFPATLLNSATSEEGRWKAADENRGVQDEYCEWTVVRDSNDNVVRVTFTSETPEYFEHLFARDSDLLLELYQGFVGGNVSLEELQTTNGSYDPRNRFNRMPGTIIHLTQRSNNLNAAVQLAAEATVLRESNGQPVTGQQALILCGQLGEHRRNSDPQIASAVNNLVRQGSDITLADPPGLHIAGIFTSGMETPDGADPGAFWMVERGCSAHALRARYEVPEGLGYGVSDITAGGRPIRFGAQLADRVQVKLSVVARASSLAPRSEPCRG